MTKASGKIGVMLCGHGSRDIEAIREFDTLSHLLKQRLPEYEVENGYLEFAHPIIRDGLETLKRRGVTRIATIPGMLFAAGHVKNDLPWEVNTFAMENRDLDILYGRDLGINHKLLKAAAERVAIAEQRAGSHVPRSDSLLLVVGRGTNDPDANANISKVARMLWEGMGFGWAETAYSGVAHPRVNRALERIVTMGFRRIIVFPYFLFTGVLVKRIYAQTDEVATDHPATEFIKALYLKDHPLVLESLVERVVDTLQGEAAMNCQLCKYRDQIVGYETSVGAVQMGHHHHVRGIGVESSHHPDHNQ
ncbi:Sirohydrochlorin cobaltochelatase [invertebrate metagenome]|uniref:Sirohydrochlorin cobaltochelatase n=1 Tax=invertebrate metagenome TaxID=1711999 RepID=A0A484H7D8_9ZZZZ